MSALYPSPHLHLLFPSLRRREAWKGTWVARTERQAPLCKWRWRLVEEDDAAFRTSRRSEWIQKNEEKWNDSFLSWHITSQTILLKCLKWKVRTHANREEDIMPLIRLPACWHTLLSTVPTWYPPYSTQYFPYSTYEKCQITAIWDRMLNFRDIASRVQNQLFDRSVGCTDMIFRLSTFSCQCLSCRGRSSFMRPISINLECYKWESANSFYAP